MAEKTKSEVREKFENKAYPIHIIGRHIEITDAIRNYAVEKLKKAERFSERILEATIILDVQKVMHTVDFILFINDHKIKVSGRSENIYASIDEASSKLDRKLRHYTQRIHEHKVKPTKEIDMNVNVIQNISLLEEINDQIEEENLRRKEESMKPPKVVKQKRMPLKLLNQQEAIFKMELSEDPFLIYLSEEDQKLKIIYRRHDGDYGIVETEK